MKPSLVSVIMPVLNGERYLRRALDSVLSQTDASWELLVVDDGSEDRTADIVRGYDDGRIRYAYQPNRGQAAALNQGLRLAEGEYLTTLDSDDWLTPGSLAARAAFLARWHEFGAVYGDGIYCDGSGRELSRFSDLMPNGISGDVYDTLIVSPFYGTGAAVMVRREALDRSRISYDESIVWCQDWDLYIRLAESTRFGHVAIAAVNYRLHAEGMTVSMPSGRRLESLLKLRSKVMHSQRFGLVPPEGKSAFFYDLLNRDLSGRPEEQARVFDSGPFREMPARNQARLMRNTAAGYLAQGANLEASRRWLTAAWMKTPLDPKTALAAALSRASPRMAGRVIRLWQGGQSRAKVNASPFEAALGSAGRIK